MTGWEMIQNTDDMLEKICIMVIDICKTMPDWETLDQEHKTARAEYTAKFLGLLK